MAEHDAESWLEHEEKHEEGLETLLELLETEVDPEVAR
jgi:hypothetical protein